MKNHIVMYHPAIPQNTGNIMRTCVATKSILHLIKPLGFQLDDRSMKRAGLDYIQNLEYHVYENWEDFVSKNPGTYYFTTRYSKKKYTDFDFSDHNSNHYFVFGHEHDGIDYTILKEHLDTCMRIPMSEDARSLNVSNCVALVLYEALRQQEFEGLSFVEVQKGEDFLYE